MRRQPFDESGDIMNMTPQAASQALRRAHSQAIEMAQPESIGTQMRQLAFDFSSCDLITDAIEAESVGAVPHLLEIPVELEQNEDGDLDLSLDNGSYVQLALNLLLTCAEDLVAVEKTLAQPNLHTRTRNNALRLKEVTTRWLREDLAETPFSFYDCTTLLETELRYQSMNQIELPAIAERSTEIADWILSDPHGAKDVLSHYLTIFSRNDESYLDLDEELDDEGGQERHRPRA
jgi:hypothetical protein